MGDAPDADAEAAGVAADAEAVVDDLVAAGVLAETDDGGVHLAEEFDATKRVYHDSYADADESRVRETIADLFDLDPAAAAEHAASVTRDELVAFLSLRSFLDDPPARERLALMAGVVAGVGPGSPVPDAVREVDDDTYRAFLDDAPDAVVTVWKHHCEPCDVMKNDLDGLLDAVPDGVAVAGLDGEDCPDFRREFEVDVAPAVCCFRDGTLVETVTGRRSTATLAETFETVYGDE